MEKQKPFILDYNEFNLGWVSTVIVDNLTLDLIPYKWVKQNEKNPMFGHCHHATACLQNIFTPKEITTYHALDMDGVYHWWAKDNSGKIIDLTADQYYSVGKTPPYYKGVRRSPLGWSYLRKTEKLMDRVVPTLKGIYNPTLEQFFDDEMG